MAKGQYLIVEDQEIDAVQMESSRTIEIDQFVPRSEIDDRYIDSPYFSDATVHATAFLRHTIPEEVRAVSDAESSSNKSDAGMGFPSK